MRQSPQKLDCEFTLALNNRTGKFFFCRDLIDQSQDLIDACYYWHLRSKKLPKGLIARVLGRLALIEVSVRVQRGGERVQSGLFRRQRPMVFTDPRECVLHHLHSSDVVLCHDMGPITHPEFYDPGVKKLYELSFKLIKAAKPLMLFVSRASRREFVHLYGDDFPILDVVYPPIRTDLIRGDVKPVANVPAKFLLSVGSIGARKNQERCIRAFEASGLAPHGYGYVICGGPEPGYDDVMAAASKTAGVLIPGYIDDAELRWLYQNAAGFVLPSMLEGFGLPAAEAIKYGLVPLLSPRGALEEVAGEQALYADPVDIASIATQMRHLAGMGEDERAARLIGLRGSISRFSLEGALVTWRDALSQALAGAP